ncbi:hypothetical protein SynA1560_01156 [Synechococcus sp. A15-60]|nr:hypothetical protein SynA1560_01156 [Synechococcus sp. A15-60]
MANAQKEAERSPHRTATKESFGDQIEEQTLSRRTDAQQKNRRSAVVNQ